MSDILIVGGGIIGMLTARELSLAGMSVTIIDKGETGQESSWAGGGIISPLYPWRYPDAVSALARWGQGFYPQLIEEINTETGLDAELIQNGLLIVGGDEWEEAQHWSDKWDVNLQFIHGEQLIEIEPALSSAVGQKAIWLPETRQVRNPRLVKATKNYLLKLGVKFLEQTEVLGFLHKGIKIRGVKSSTGDIFTDKVLVTSGAWSARLLKDMDINLNIEPVKGQMILFKTKADSVKRIVLSEDRYVIPRKDGRVLVGSTLERTGFEKSISTKARDDLKIEASRIIPHLAHAEIEHHWAGLRPGSLNGTPYICAVSGHEGLFVNTGHFRNGVVLGPASARLMSDIILQRKPIFDVKDYQCN